MFDEHARSLFDDFPEFPGLTTDDSSAHYRTHISRLFNSVLMALMIRSRRYRKHNHTFGVSSNTLMFHVVLSDSQSASDRRAAAFVAAEAIALMADFISAIENLESSERVSASVRSPERLARIESALLYLYAQYDACAGGVLSAAEYHIQEAPDLVDQAADYCFEKWVFRKSGG